MLYRQKIEVPALGTIPFYNNAEHDLLSALKHGKMEEEAPMFPTPARISSIQSDQDIDSLVNQ